jgi:acyl dehydratase
MPADHRFPDHARANPLDSTSQYLDARLAHRYAEVSGDWAAHHFDIDVARAAGFDFVFTHGLCTMAICTHRLLDLLGVKDPARVARVAVRFASPTPLDEALTVNAYGIDQNSFAFEATSRGVCTITHGRLELRP